MNHYVALTIIATNGFLNYFTGEWKIDSVNVMRTNENSFSQDIDDDFKNNIVEI